MTYLFFSAFKGAATSVSLPLTGVALFLIGIFLYQSFKKASVDGGTQVSREGTTTDNKPNPWYKQTQSYFALAVLVAWVAVMFIVQASYKPSKKSYPIEKLDDGREAAEDQIKR